MTKIRNGQYLVNLMVLVMAAGQQINCFGPNKQWMILLLDIHAALLDFISHKPGVSLMLLGPLVAVQTLMACGLATTPSSRKLGIVSQLRFVFDWGWGCPYTGIWLWSSVKYIQGLLLNYASRNTNCSEWGKIRREDTEASPVSKKWDQGKQVSVLQG